MDKISINTFPFKDQILQILAKHLKGRRYGVYLFGSRARGNATPYSDYDIGIMANEPLPLSTMAVIEEDFEELPVMQKIDLVDLKAASVKFFQNALKESLLLDER